MEEARPTPTDLRELAARAGVIAAETVAMQALLRSAGDEPTRRVGWRLDDGAGWLRQAAEALSATAEELLFIRDVPGRPHCAADWGCCPDHGATLTDSGGACRCRAPGCGRTWAWNRIGLPCDEPPVFRVVDAAGAERGLVCAGHAMAASKQVAGHQLLPRAEVSG